MSISLQKNCFFLALFSALCISCHLKISPLVLLSISSDHSKIYAVAEDGVFWKAGLNPPRQRCQGCVYSSLLFSSERHSALRMPRQAQGAGAKAATYAQLSKQPVPAPSRDLSHWSGTSQLGTAEPCAGLGWPSWHQPHVGKNSLMRNSRTPQIPQELPKGWWLAVCSYICRSAIEPFSN